MRLKLVPGKARDVKYELSGQTDRVLAVRAVNGSGEYLESGGSSASGRLIGRGKSVTKSFKGQPKAAEIIIASEEVEKDYPFELRSLDMVSNTPSYSKSPALPPMDRKEFAAKFASTEYDTPCEEGKPEQNAGPFLICSLQLSQDFRFGSSDGTSLHPHPAKRNHFSTRKRRRLRRDRSSPLLAPHGG